jgi:hypothetical protein
LSGFGVRAWFYGFTIWKSFVATAFLPHRDHRNREFAGDGDHGFFLRGSSAFGR